MSYLNPLSWQNENALSNYPLDNFTNYPNFIVDANFIQFDFFIPILKYVLVETTSIKLTVLFDYGLNQDITFNKAKFLQGDVYKFIRIYNDDNSRYLGTLTLDSSTLDFWENYIGRQLIYDAKFKTSTVKSIPKNHGVYTFDNTYGDIVITTPTEDKTIFYNTYKFNSLKSNLIFNAVTYHEITNNSQALKKINLVKPVDNNITLSSNDLIKITPSASTGENLEISLVTGKPDKTFIIPTLIS
jgi:hypothetical protein